ncbi:hypothetical protein AvCA_06920 [Azotobacter vinelandii CA]|uniref:Uncharacterized protein n=2 Tax=Azotobacter vinelandii TaxID=354 RepID=C1DLJ4_AZOVD|nr:hypothetical protein Avin_06920 [Azotobacter vinelandii DJ]AGK17219.1 hypothetical protein AvCA_06920 [Azotobacter vinelandii CA]AGK19452.1 hypothetical protein AvCA6_06920 [Azotobacter vinelandii CA6]
MPGGQPPGCPSVMGACLPAVHILRSAAFIHSWRAGIMPTPFLRSPFDLKSVSSREDLCRRYASAPTLCPTD